MKLLIRRHGQSCKVVSVEFGTDDERLEMLNYVVDTKNQEFIFKFAEQARVFNADLLVALHRKKSPKMIEEAFKVFRFSQDGLKRAASEPELMCSPKDLLKLLDRIEKQEHQEEVIENGIYNLFKNNRTECIDPLLNALEGSESFKHLKDITIKRAFMEGSYHGNKLIVEHFYDDPAVTSEDYAAGLFDSGAESTQNPIFIFLLGEADQDDFNAVKKHWSYKVRSNELKEAIENALLTANPGGTRLTPRIKRAELVMKTFLEDPSMRIPTVISQLIAFYLVDGLTPNYGTDLVNTKQAFDKSDWKCTVNSELIAFNG